MTTIRDIAKKANVSVATVSRVIHGNGYVKKETKEIVEEIILETGYQRVSQIPDQDYRDFHTVAVLLPSVTDPFYSEILCGVRDYLNTQKFNVMIFSTNEDETEELNTIRGLQHQKFDGIIISPVNIKGSLSRESIDALDQLVVPVVVVGRDMRFVHFDNIFMEEECGAFDAVSLLLRNGHRHIGMLCGHREITYMNQRYNGYVAALTNCSGNFDPDYVCFGDMEVEEAYQMTDHLLSLNPSPTAIFCSDPIYTLGFVKYMLDHQMVIGRDLSVVSYGDVELLSALKFNITSVIKKSFDMGEHAAEVLLKRITYQNSSEIIRTALVPEIKIRGSEKMQGLTPASV
jgi:LacI family transcriptional regulator